MQRKNSTKYRWVYAGFISMAFFLFVLHTTAQIKYSSENLSPAARESFEKNKSSRQTYVVTADNLDSLLLFLAKWPSMAEVLQKDIPSHSLVIKTNAAFIRNKLLTVNGFRFADIRITPHTETGIIGYNRSFHGLSAVDYLLPGANGKNITTGVKEQKMEAADLDLYKRVIPSSLASATVTNHATVISSIIGGAGNSFYDGRGIANRCNFFSSSFINLFPDDQLMLAANQVTVQNHSYGTIVQSFYGAEAVSYDAQTWANKNIVHVFSAGNQGAAAGSGIYNSISGFANLTGNFKMAKNIITVGAIDNKGIIPAESSSGPLHDGRIGPHLIALGPNGTSDAAAVVTGTVAVMQQVYADSNSAQIPPASLIKAVLYNTADDVYRAGIDYKSGYGILNSLEAIKAIQQRKYEGGQLSQNQQWTKTIAVPAGSAALKVTLAWTDSTGAVNNTKALINDLDMEVVQLTTGNVFRPWVLSSVPQIDSLHKLPIRKRDSLNTAEQVSLQLPAAGSYAIRVTGTTVPATTLPFHIAWQVDTLNTFHFTYPVHTADVNLQENPLLNIRWRTFVADTNTTGNLYVSYSNGVAWQLIKATHKIYTQQYQWTIKDTASTALFKMETPFGDFLSSPFVISKVINPRLDFYCTDSFGLSWQPHIYASSYKIYALTDSPYLKHIRTVSDTLTSFKRSQYPYEVYAVEPVLNNAIPAARSIAQNITLQSVNCFYKALNYVLLDSSSVRLSLELSTAYYVDSISFERVTGQGLLLQPYGPTKVSTGMLLYNQLVEALPAGLNYFRARIRLRDGNVIYTEIVSVLCPGKLPLYVYPNPAQSGSTLTYLLQNQVQFFQLQLLDIQGRNLKQWEVGFGGTLNLPVLPAGFYLLRLTDGNGKNGGTVRLVIQ